MKTVVVKDLEKVAFDLNKIGLIKSSELDVILAICGEMDSFIQRHDNKIGHELADVFIEDFTSSYEFDIVGAVSGDSSIRVQFEISTKIDNKVVELITTVVGHELSDLIEIRVNDNKVFIDMETLVILNSVLSLLQNPCGVPMYLT